MGTTNSVEYSKVSLNKTGVIDAVEFFEDDDISIRIRTTNHVSASNFVEI